MRTNGRDREYLGIRADHRATRSQASALFACSAGRMLRWTRDAAARGELRVVEVLPRYHPRWARWVVRVPGLREVVSWNVVIVVEKR